MVGLVVCVHARCTSARVFVCVCVMQHATVAVGACELVGVLCM